MTDALNNKILLQDEAPGATDVVIRVWVQSQNKVYARNLDPARFKVGQMIPVPADWPLGDVTELPVMSGACSGCLDYLDEYGGQLRIGEDTSGYNARVLLGLHYDSPLSGRYRPVQNDCSGVVAELPEVIEPTKPVRMEPIYLTDADPDLHGEGVFIFNSTKLTVLAEAKLNALLAEASPGDEFVVEAGCDKCGTTSFNEGLSKRRVQAIAEILRSKGFKIVLEVPHGETLAKVTPKTGDCDKGFPEGASDRFLMIHTPA
ncbi:hypothetical protein ACFL0Z_02075 [Patescibacteria group bacterium]